MRCLFHVFDALTAGVCGIYVQRSCAFHISFRIQECDLQVQWQGRVRGPSAPDKHWLLEVGHRLLPACEQVAVAIAKFPLDYAVAQRIRRHLVQRPA